MKQWVYAAKVRAPFATLGIRTDAGAVVGVTYLPRSERAMAPSDAIAERAVREIERFLEIKGEENRDRLLPAERERLMRRLQRVEKTARELRLKLGLASGT